MKIHIVRKGDTLWEIAKQYGVDFEQLKQFNPQLSSPDMIMPGMKIKIPSSTKSVKKEAVSAKETKLPIAKEQPKQLPVVKEDDHEKPKEVKIEMPEKFIPEPLPKSLSLKKEVPIQKEVPKVPVKPVKEAPIVKEVPKAPVKPIKEIIKMPVLEEESPVQLPKPSQPKQKKEEKVVHQIPVAPIYHHYYHHCCPPPYHHCCPAMGEMTEGFMPHHQMHHGHENMMYHMPHHQMPLQQQQMMQSHDCGCHAPALQMQQYQMRGQIPPPFPIVNFEPFEYRPNYSEHSIHPNLRELPPLQPNFGNELHDANEKPFPMPPPYPAFSQFNTQEDGLEQRPNENESTNK